MGSGASTPRAEVQTGDLRKNIATSDDDKSSPKDETDVASASASTESSGCPMKRGDGSYSYDWKAMFRSSFPHGPNGKRPLGEQEAREKVSEEQVSESSASSGDSSTSGCPVKHKEYNVYSQPIDPKNNMPKVANQLPSPGQTKELPTERVQSSIPKGGADEGTTWTYPSPQMFYNALARKGKLDDTEEQDITSVVALHNNMNEKTWRKVLEWEATLDPASKPPKLLKFQGRPTDLSPKAMAKHYLLGHPLPYDRHDWTILRDDGTTVRYVIDYYHDEKRAADDESSGMPDLHNVDATPSLLVDVRPALDGPTHLWNRVVTMPYARHIEHSSPFEPLPMRPTADMKSQVSESVQVWNSIQAAAAAKTSKQSSTVPEDEDGGMDLPDVTEAQAQELSKQFAKTLEECRLVSERLKRVDASDEDRAKARVDLSICMAKILCPLQHTTLMDAIREDSDAKIEAAMFNVSECVFLKTTEHAAATQKYPKYFD